MWTAVVDGYIITQRMSDDDVWFRCNLFGREPLIDALERFLKDTEDNGHKD
jgi:hypothetical protein